jgi:hypothetical protein
MLEDIATDITPALMILLGAAIALMMIGYLATHARTRKIGGLRFFWFGKIVVSVCVKR